MITIDFKGGKVEWEVGFSSIDPSKDLAKQNLSEDLLWIVYDKIHIDVGWYRDRFCIYVICDKCGWENQEAKIPCFTYEDMMFQLQRAIDIYPGKTGCDK